MQTHGGAAAEAAILGTERVFRAKVRVDWKRDGQFDHVLSNLDRFIDEVETDRSLEGSAPQEVLLIEGSSSAELTLTLHGDYNGLPLVSLFSPFNRVGPLAGIQTIDAEVKYSLILDTPVGSFEYPQFIGNLRTITPDRGSASVQFTALDRAEKMRKPIQLPPFAISHEHISYGEIDTQYIRSHWVIDHVLRHCDSGVSDKRPTSRQELGLIGDALDGPLLFVSGNGSYLPSIGYLDNPNFASFPNAGNPMYNDNAPVHPNAPAGSARPQALAGTGTPIDTGHKGGDQKGWLPYWVADVERLNPASVHYFGCTLNLQSNPQSVSSVTYLLFQIILGGGYYINAYVSGGQVWWERVYDNGASTPTYSYAYGPKVNIPNTGGNVDIFLMFDLTAGRSRAWARAGSNTSGSTWTNTGSALPRTLGFVQRIDNVKGRATVGQAISISNVVYGTSQRSDRPVADYQQVYRTPSYLARCDRGLNLFSYVPTHQKQEAWELVKEVAAAEFGSVFWDENGVFQFWNWKTMLDKRASVVRTFSLDHVEGLKVSNNLDSVRNVFNLTTSQKRSSMGPVHVFSASDINEFYVPPRSTKIFTIWRDDVVSPLTWYLTRYASMNNNQGIPRWSSGNVHGFIAQFQSAGNWSEFNQHGTPRVKVYFSMDGHLQIKITNNTIYPMRMSQGWPGDSTQPAVSPAAKLEFNGTLIESKTDLVFTYRNEESIAKYGERVLDLSGEWYQDGTWDSGMLDLITPRTGEPVPTTDAITVAGDPRLQLGDVIRVTDENQGMGNMFLQLFGIRRRFSREEGLTDTLSVEMLPPANSTPPTTDPGEPNPSQTITRVNLCDNPSLLNDAEGWYGVDEVNPTGMDRDTGAQIASGVQGVAPQARITAGRTYRGSAQIKGLGSTQVRIGFDWYSDNGYLATASGTTVSVSNGTVTRVYTPASVAPQGATRLLMTIAPTSTSVQATAVLYEETTTQSSFFDGDTTGARWDGARGNSTSRLTEVI